MTPNQAPRLNALQALIFALFATSRSLRFLPDWALTGLIIGLQSIVAGEGQGEGSLSFQACQSGRGIERTMAMAARCSR